MSQLRYNLFLKAAIIGALILLLLIPALLIGNLIDERQTLRRDAIEEVSSKWAGEQTLDGPFLSIPFNDYDEQGKKWVTHYLHIMPENLKISGDITTQKLHRGIYDVVVYNSDLKITGDFSNIDYKGIPKDRICFDRAIVSMGISDLRGIEEQMNIHLGDQDYRFDAGLVNKDVVEQGVHTVVNLTGLLDSAASELPFTMSLLLKGSEQLMFCPIGGNTDVKIHSNWNNPSFTGNFLTSDKEINEKGFNAHWKMMHLNRSFPQSWNGYLQSFDPERSSFGVKLLLPVDGYQKSTRCVKYSILFTTITFLLFFFVEISRKRLVHPLQYLLVGVALIVFYTLLISISEYLAFNLAYIIASLATIILITLYSKAVLKSWQLGAFVGGVLVILYGYLFTIIQLQDYALLAGSIFIFVVLCLVMYFSRKVDWYNLSVAEKKENAPEVKQEGNRTVSE